MPKSENPKPNASSAPTCNIQTVSPTGSSIGLLNNFGTIINHIPQGENSILDEKWWPEKKHLVKSFYNRKLDNGQLMVEKLHAMLQESKATVITQETIVVSGLGGIGKTSIAKSFANHYEAEYNHIVWIDCGEGSLIKSFQSFARDLGVDSRVELLNELARKCFAKIRNLKCLIIYDNAECFVGNEGIRDALPKCEGNSNLHSIITSRNQEWGTSAGYGKINTFCISVFKDNESLQFMKNSLSNASTIDDSQIRRLCELLGHLPLALQIAVATLNNEGITITGYIEQIVNDNEELLNETFDDYERTINKTMKISLDQIKTNENGKHAYTILMTFGYIQPDNVTLSFLLEAEVGISYIPIRKAIALLEKFSLVNVTNDLDIVDPKISPKLFVSIHRLLQQVIRHNGKETEKEKLKQILSSEGDINYKLIPYTFAEKHEDLKQEFTHIRAQLIDQVQLADLLKERRFVEAADLALIIHESFSERLSQKEYLISMYNHAVCLEKSGQINKSVDVLRSFVNELNSVAKNSWEWIEEMGDSWTIDEKKELEFHLKELSGAIPNRIIILIYIALRQKSEDKFFQYHKLRKSHFINISKLQKFDPLSIMFHLGLIISNGKDSLLIPEEFTNSIGNYKYKKNSVDFFTWLEFSLKLAKVAIKLISRNAKNNWMPLTKLFFVSRKFIFEIEYKEFQTNSSECKLICEDLHTLSCIGNSTNEDVQYLQNIISELLAIIEKECGTANGWKKFIPQVNAGVEYEVESEPTSHSGNGNLTYKTNAFGVFFTHLPNPELLKSLTLEGMTVYMPYLLSSITQCSNLVKIELKEVQFWGVTVYKMSLPKLKHFELSLVDKDSKEIVDSNVIDFCTFFGGKDSCIWKSLKNLNFFHIGYKSERFIKFDKQSKVLTLDRVSINRCHYQLNNFHKLDIRECTFLINSSDNGRDCVCGFCVDNLDKSPRLVDEDNDQFLFSTEEMIIEYSSFLDIKSNKRISINRFLVKFKHLKNLVIDYCTSHIVDLFGLDYKIIGIRGTKFYYSRSTPKRTDKNSQLSKRCKKLSLIEVTPVDNNEEEVKTIEMISKNGVLMMFTNLKYLKIDNCRCHLVDLFGLDYIKIIVIRMTKVHCSRSTLKSQFSKSCKKLSLIEVTPVDDKGRKVKTIDFSVLSVEKLKWQDRYWDGYFVRIDRIPSELKKLVLKGVDLESGETNSISKHSNSKDNIASSLHTIIMEALGSYELSLDLGILPQSLKEIKLYGVNLTGQFTPHNPFHLNKIILDNYKMEDFLKDDMQSLIRRVDTVVIIMWKEVLYLENLVTPFPCNVKRVDVGTRFPEWKYVSYTKFDDSSNWSKETITNNNEITEKEFYSKAEI